MLLILKISLQGHDTRKALIYYRTSAKVLPYGEKGQVV